MSTARARTPRRLHVDGRRCIRRGGLALALALVSALSVVACNDSEGGCASDADDLDGEYYNAPYDFEMVLEHDCETGEVVGTLYDDGDLAYDLTGTVRRGEFDWEASRDRPSGGSDLFYSPNGMQIESRGLSFTGRVVKNGTGPAGALTFELQE